MGGSAIVGAEAFRRAQVLRPEPDRGFDLVTRCSQNATLAGESAVMRIPLRRPVMWTSVFLPAWSNWSIVKVPLNFLPVGLRTTSSRMLPGPTRLLLVSQLIAK